MSHIQNDRVKDDFEEWLDDKGVVVDDILYDDKGKPYVNVENENGTAGEDGYEITVKKIFVPERFISLIND